MKTLALRDHMTARHSAAVARYAREMAAALGLSPEEQELFHTAGLFHDIGKFIFPDSDPAGQQGPHRRGVRDRPAAPGGGSGPDRRDRGLRPGRRHRPPPPRAHRRPRLPVRHPRRSDPARLADASRSRTSTTCSRPATPTATLSRRVRRSTSCAACAGTQLDARLVEVFIELVSRRGLMFSHSSADDFEAELALERRVSDYAAPRRGGLKENAKGFPATADRALKRRRAPEGALAQTD